MQLTRKPAGNKLKYWTSIHMAIGRVDSDAAFFYFTMFITHTSKKFLSAVMIGFPLKRRIYVWIRENALEQLS